VEPRTAPEGTLAGDHTDAPGLPRGRSSLAPREASALQRERLIRAALSAAADHGYRRTTVREIARRARVSLRTFYEHFSDRQDCVLTAVDEAVAAISGRVDEALRSLPDDSPPIARLRAAFEANLHEWASEPELSTVLHLELRAAGPAGRERYFEILGGFARFCRAWHRDTDPAGAAKTPPEAYRMAMGALEQLVVERVHAGRADELDELADPGLRVTLAILSEWGGPVKARGSRQ
jgi:AcrR family transcriptional regulator